MHRQQRKKPQSNRTEASFKLRSWRCPALTWGDPGAPSLQRAFTPADRATTFSNDKRKSGNAPAERTTIVSPCEALGSAFDPNEKSPDPCESGLLNKILAVSYSHMGRPHTTIGAERFHFRVRKGIGWFPLAIAARKTGLPLAIWIFLTIF